MHRSTLERLACPSCRQPYKGVAHDSDDQRIINGYLQCDGCAIVIPVIESFAFFTEPHLHQGQVTPAALTDLGQQLFGSARDFGRYHQQKNARDTLEVYAAFQPFNESTRAFTPLIPYIEPHLDDGGLIVDTWGRTGWSGEWLAGLFPEQRVLSIWEGNSSVLAYRGYRHLLPWQHRAKNLDIIFTHPERPLPLQSDSVGLLYGLDSLHRYSFYPFVPECLRVTQSNGCCVFPHIHLTNSEPSPYFERGCNQLHGQDYRAWLDQLSATSGRRGWVMSEQALFEGPDIAALEDESDTAHYNGLVLILPDSTPPRPPEPDDLRVHRGDHTRYLVNPLLRFNPIRSTVSVSGALHDGEAGHLLLRHPVYRNRLPAQPLALSTVDWLALIHALHGASADSIGQHGPSLVDALERLSENDVVLPATISSTAHQLQRFHSNQLPATSITVTDFWSRMTQAEIALDIPEFGVLSGDELAQLAAGIAALLQQDGLQPGSLLTVTGKAEPLLVMITLIAASLGATARFAEWHGGQSPQEPEYVIEGGQPATARNVLLSRLEQLPQPWPALSPGETGTLSFPGNSEWLSCSLDQLLNASAALEHQLEAPAWAAPEGPALQQLMAFSHSVLSTPAGPA